MCMRFRNFTGFILGNARHEYRPGMQWVEQDERLWVCPNLDTARRVLIESHKRLAVEHKPIWTTVYQVSGRDVVFEKGLNGLLYTDTPSKLFVERRVWVQMPKMITEEDLLANAGVIRNKLAKIWENVK